MPNIQVRKRSPLKFNNKKFSLENSSPPIWCVTLEGGTKALVRLVQSNQHVDVFINEFEITTPLYSSLQKNDPDKHDSFSKDEQNEMCRLTKVVGEAKDKVLELIKYHLNHQEISEELTKGGGIEWSIDGKQWQPLSQGVDTISLNIQILKLNKTNIQNIQRSLDDKIAPLTAMRHLHRAQKETQPHHKWIEATIAAELAVKEILIRTNPHLEYLLLELPSPPLTKLYGKILEKYLGERSPFVNQLGKGVETRNKLIHTPNTERIDLKKAFDYVDTVEAAVFHLLVLAYPNDKLLQYTSSSHSHFDGVI